MGNSHIPVQWLIRLNQIQQEALCEPDPSDRARCPPWQKSTAHTSFLLPFPPAYAISCSSSHYLLSPRCTNFQRHVCRVYRVTVSHSSEASDFCASNPLGTRTAVSMRPFNACVVVAVAKFYHDPLEISQSKGKGLDVELIALHQLLKQNPSGTVPKKEAQCCFIMLALNKRIKSCNLEIKISGVALLIWAAKEKEESCSYSPCGIEVLTTKGFVVGGGWLSKSTFISGYGQEERYVAIFDYFIKMQYDDSPLLLNENVTHGCVVRIYIDMDVFLQTVNDKGYEANGDFEFVFKMMSLHSSILPKQRNSEKSNYPLVITWFEYCWRSFRKLSSQLNLVYDRGKIWLTSIWVKWMSGLRVLKHLIETSDVNRVKFGRLTTLATCDMVTELCEYAANVDIPNAKEVFQVIGKMAVQQYDANVVNPLQFHEMEKGITTRLLVPCIEGFATDDSINGIVRLLGIEENAALTILDAANELDCHIAKDATDDIFSSVCSKK
ncbi:hypothetical protein OROGR_001744 [Orobanche gracilis]